MKKIIYIFFLLNILAFGKNKTTINYKENEPLLGKGFYLKIGEVPIATYENTIGYFSTVEIVGKNLEIKNELKKIIIKNNNEIIEEKNIEWKNEIFEIKGINLNGLVISLKWDNLEKDQMNLMIEEWDLEKKSYNLDIEYQYENKTESTELTINMPTFNPDIYLDINPNLTILKQQEYNKNYLILNEIKLNDYNMNIIKNSDSPDGLKVKLKSTLSIGNDEYLGTVKLVPLIEKYTNIYIEESNSEDIFKNSNKISIGLQLPEDIKFNESYKIFGNLLELNYGKNKKEILDKVIIFDGKIQVKKVIALKRSDDISKKIYLDDSSKEYSILEEKGKLIGNYKNLKIKVNEEEFLINENGDSDYISIPIGNLQIENGKIVIFLENIPQINQGKKINFKTLNLKNEILEDVEIQVYFEN